ncbi:MAG TPA: alpha-amylase/4-alpha-glucanotransferase domain-containing protein, partial [bacterium]
MSGRYYELGDFVGKPYERANGASLTGSSFEIARTAAVVDNKVELRKAVVLPVGEAALQITYRIRNTSQIPLTILFAPEFNFALMSGDCPERYYYQTDRGLEHAPLNSIGICEAVRRFSLFDEDDGFAVHFEFAEPTEIWRYPCETVSQSEGGFERNYQSSCVLPIFRLTVAGEGEFSTSFRVRLQLLR